MAFPRKDPGSGYVTGPEFRLLFPAISGLWSLLAGHSLPKGRLLSEDSTWRPPDFLAFSLKFWLLVPLFRVSPIHGELDCFIPRSGKTFPDNKTSRDEFPPPQTFREVLVHLDHPFW